MAAGQLRLPGDDVPQAAVAVRWYGTHTHAGILHRQSDGQLYLLHLGGDVDLENELFTGGFAWIVPHLLPEELNDVRAVCRSICRHRPEIFYCWVLDVEAQLDPEASRLVSEVAPYGLTCSSFVLAVFHTAHVRLINLDGWLDRTDDAVWYARLAQYHRRNGMPENRVQILERNTRVLRVRPEEVAGACMERNLPAFYRTCEPNGRAVLDRLTAQVADPDLLFNTQR